MAVIEPGASPPSIAPVDCQPWFTGLDPTTATIELTIGEAAKPPESAPRLQSGATACPSTGVGSAFGSRFGSSASIGVVVLTGTRPLRAQ